MKKIITALMIFGTLLCFTACKPGSDLTPPVDDNGTDNPGGDITPPDNGPGNVDTTTIDGTYVVTFTLNGKPANEKTLIISGTTESLYSLYPTIDTDYPTAEALDSFDLCLEYSDDITRDDENLSFTDSEGSYKLVTDSTGTWLVDTSDSTKQFQKVEAGKYGTPDYSIDYYLREGGAVFVGIYGEDDCDATLYTENDGYESLLSTTNGNVITADGIYPFSGDPDRDGGFIVTLNGNTATVSDLKGFPDGEDPSGVYTKYTRSTPWPSLPND